MKKKNFRKMLDRVQKENSELLDDIRILLYGNIVDKTIVATRYELARRMEDELLSGSLDTSPLSEMRSDFMLKATQGIMKHLTEEN